MELKVNLEEPMFGKRLGLSRERSDELFQKMGDEVNRRDGITAAEELEYAASICDTLNEFAYLAFAIGHLRGMEEAQETMVEVFTKATNLNN